MNIKIDHKKIKEMCGAVSFKRGEAFYKDDRVKIESDSPDLCRATVGAAEDFHVTIEKNAGGDAQTSCSCPKLASVKNDCQHIAAVLLAIEGQQRSHALLTLFDEHAKRSSREQRHFENRQLLDAVFFLTPVILHNDRIFFAISVNVEGTNVTNIREFLKQVNAGKASAVYTPDLHCFPEKTDAVLQQLIQVVQDEKEYAADAVESGMLLIPPSVWEPLAPLLVDTPSVRLVYDGAMYNGLHLSNELPPLQFDFSETAGRDCELRIKGLKNVMMLSPYKCVLYKGRIIQLENERLFDLKRMLDDSGADRIPIPSERIGYFLEKVVPGLKKFGDVRLSEAISKRLLKTPLTAKLYLDRVKNRLLAGLEFHYEQIVFNPLENRELQAGSLLIRDEECENEIMELMESSSFTRTDSGYFLHNEALEYDFLYNAVPKLQKLVQIYATTAVRNRIFKKKTHPRIRVRNKKERTDWLEFKFEIDNIPQKHIKDILEALEEKRKYYRLQNGTLLSLESREFEEIQRFLRAGPVQDEDLEKGLNVPIVRGLRMLDAADDRVFTLEESFRQFLENIRNPENSKIIIPESLESILRDYQKLGFKWMKTLANYGFGGILADDMGLGKTLQSITFIVSELPVIRNKNQPALIVCPSSLTYNWLSEIRKFAPELKAAVIDGKKKERLEKQNNPEDIDVVITSYPLLLKDIKQYETQSFHTVFFDEAQAFKNPLTQTAKAVKMLEAGNRFALTGTPVENSPEELWSIFHVVFPELFMGLKDYSNLTRKQIARRIRPFLLRRKKEEVLPELPVKMTAIETSELFTDQKKLYAAYLAKLRQDTLKHLNRDTLRKNRIKILAGITRLRQICCHPALFVDGYKGSSAKFEQLMQIVEESRLSGRRVLIFSQFTKMLKLIGQELSMKGRSFFWLDGQTPSVERIERCNRFNAGERDIFLISLKAGGTGLNLTGADTVILYDIWWNPAVEQQAADRAHRIGQTKDVQVIKLIAHGTIEEKMNELQDKKRHLVEEIIEANGQSAAGLTEEDIREILSI